MSKSMNRVTLVGNVGKEPEVKPSQNGQLVAKFTVATSTGGYRSKDGRDIPEVTQWHNITAFGAICSAIGQHIHKGTRVMVEGRIEYREYEKDGQKRYITEIVLTDLILLSQPQQSQAAPQPTQHQPMGAPQYNDGLPF